MMPPQDVLSPHAASLDQHAMPTCRPRVHRLVARLLRRPSWRTEQQQQKTLHLSARELQDRSRISVECDTTQCNSRTQLITSFCHQAHGEIIIPGSRRHRHPRGQPLRRAAGVLRRCATHAWRGLRSAIHPNVRLKCIKTEHPSGRECCPIPVQSSTHRNCAVLPLN